MIRELLAQGKSRKEVVNILIANKMAAGPAAAEFMIAVELQEVPGDVIVVDEPASPPMLN